MGYAPAPRLMRELLIDPLGLVRSAPTDVATSRRRVGSGPDGPLDPQPTDGRGGRLLRLA